jgi:thioredoxin-related protein
MLVFPAVYGISQNWTAGRTLRLNLTSDVNKEYADSLGVKTTPTFILFDASGNELAWWVGEAPELEDLPQ